MCFEETKEKSNSQSSIRLRRSIQRGMKKIEKRKRNIYQLRMKRVMV